MQNTINWNRCVHIDAAIDDALIAGLVPKILALRQESNSAITVALNSPGGSVHLLRTIRSLVRDADQDGKTCELVTVATHRASSAAAMLLAMGDYAVALPESEVLFHEVRYGNVRDVTPTAAKQAAQSLDASNDRASLEIANHMITRWMWMYFDVHGQAAALRAEFPQTAEQFEEAVRMINMPKCDYIRMDLVGLMLFIHKHLASKNECILVNALTNLAKWGAVTTFAARPLYRVPGTRKLGTLDGLAQLYKEVDGKGPLFGGSDNATNLNIFLTVLVLSLPTRTASDAVALAARELNLFSSINNRRHWHTAMKLMLKHKFTFFELEIAKKWDELEEVERGKIAEESSPIVRLIWLLCVLVARELFAEEHRLSAREALVLGLVDEVPGDDTVESNRAFGKRNALLAE